MLGTISTRNDVDHFCRQVREDGFQRVTGVHNVKRIEEEEGDETTAHDLSTAQTVSSTCPPRNMCHTRRVLETIHRWSVKAALR